MRDLARAYTSDALTVLYEIAMKGENDSSRVTAANSLLDRGYGKPSIVLAGDEEGGPVKSVQRIELIGVAAHEHGADQDTE